jgi:hypothetical protein
MNELEGHHPARPEDAFLELLFGEQILLWGIRIWVSSYRNDSNTHNLIHLAYTHAGVPSAHIELNTVMEMITAAGNGIMDIFCPSCIKISADEMRLMAAIAAWQHGSCKYDGDIYLECWAKPATLRILRPTAKLLAKTFKDGGLLIRPRPWSISPFLPSRQSTYTSFQPVTIH